MAFQIKDFVSIGQSMINYLRATQERVTDFSVGSVARTLIEAPAIEIEELYHRMLAGVTEAIPVSIYRAFNFELIEATPARGYVVVTLGGPVQEPFVVPAGSLFKGKGLTFISERDVAANLGDTVLHIPVMCDTPGAVGNVPAGAITESLTFTFPAGASISNDPFFSGRDSETEEERKARFVDFIRSISRGTVESILYAARSAMVYSDTGAPVEFVTRAGHEEQAGHMDVWIYGSGGIASDALVAAAQRIVDGYVDEQTGEMVPGYRPAGVRVRVLKMSERFVDITLHVAPLPGYQIDAQIRDDIHNAVGQVFETVEPGSVLNMDKVESAALGVVGVREAFVANNENIVCGNREVLKLGNLEIVDVTTA